MGVVATVKHSCITFNECRKLNIKNPLFNANGGFFVLESVEEDSAEKLIDGADGEQSLRLDGRKACNIKRVGISQAESNKATVCALPSIHLPLTREARTWCEARDSAFF